MLLDFAESIDKRPALDDVSVQAHPGRRSIHAGVAVNQYRPCGGVLRNGQRAGNELASGRIVVLLVANVVEAMIADEPKLVGQRGLCSGVYSGKRLITVRKWCLCWASASPS